MGIVANGIGSSRVGAAYHDSDLWDGSCCD
jgi:hypothetical protein